MKTFKATLANLRPMLLYIEEYALEVGFSPKDIHKIQLASEEVLVNVINYAYPEQKSPGDVEIACRVKKGESLVIVVKDKGVFFNPLKAEEVDINMPLEKRSIGGLGIFFFLKSMDKFRYSRDNDCNVLTITKYVSN